MESFILPQETEMEKGHHRNQKMADVMGPPVLSILDENAGAVAP